MLRKQDILHLDRYQLKRRGNEEECDHCDGCRLEVALLSGVHFLCDCTSICA